MSSGPKFARRLIACVAMALLLAGVAGPLRAADPFELNVLVSQTGSAGFFGGAETAVLGILERQLNREGGVRGRQIRFVIHDDQSNPVIALQLANELISKHVPIILGPDLTSLCNAISPLLTSGPVMYCFSPGVHPPEGAYTFSSSISTADFTKSDVRYMRMRGWTKIAAISTTDGSGQDGDRAIDAAMALPENDGHIAIIDREHYNPTDVSVAAQVSRIKASGAQAIYAYAVGTPFGTVLHGAFEAGLDLPIFTTAANYNFTQLATYESFEPQKLYMSLAAYIAPDNIPRGRLRDAVTSYLDGLKTAGLRTAQIQIAAWDPSAIAVSAFRSLGTGATPPQIRSYIANLQGWTGIEGIYDFRKIPQRGIGGDWVFVAHWDTATHTMVPASKAGGAPL